MTLAGQTLGQYEVVETLGRGGMGTVYKGYQHSVDRYVAIKVLPPHPGLDEEFRQRFQLEARTIGSLQHPHILSLYDYGSQEDILYLVMAYADGGTLDDLIKDAPMPINRVESIIRQLAGALDYAHRREIVHRDIKPGNILFDSGGNVLLADFGIVKMLSGDGELTGTAVVGTPAYMAPEQSQGMDIDGRVDVYALGIMAFQMLTGKQPYKSDNPMQLLIKHINDPIPSILDFNEDLPSGIVAVMKKVLAKNPDDRYQTATEFAEAFSTGIHQRDESLADARAAVPLPGDVTQAQHPGIEAHAGTQIGSPLPDGTVVGQTVIIREKSSPVTLLAVAGVMAVAIVIVAVLLITQNNPPNDEFLEVDIETLATEFTVPVSTEPEFGEVRFTSVNNPGDALLLQVKSLAQPGSGRQYVAWLQNTETEETLRLGTILIDAFGEGSQSFTPEIEDMEMMLPARFNRIALTQEESGDVETPGGDIIYEGIVPI
ncbi:MAG: serine/threonine protein kinase, partial [Aggregatilineales bacterium]